MHINYFRRYVTLGRPPPHPLSQSVTLGRPPPPPRERYVIVERPPSISFVTELFSQLSVMNVRFPGVELYRNW